MENMSMVKFRSLSLVLFVVLLQAQPQMAAEKMLAATPPMGWNSWDSYGTTITEAEFKTAADWFAEHLKPYGWQYLVVDEAWTITNPVPQGNAKDSIYTLDSNGRYIPALNRFPSSANGAGFKPLSDYVHSLGLKFGFHILRGIPKKAVEKNLPISGSGFTATDAANTSDTCPWNFDNYGLKDSPAGQAYYDSIAALYASWDADFIKVDCIASRPYVGAEIRMLATAIKKTGRPIVLSLSPGAAPFEKVEEMRQYSQLWRISDDVWDMWHSTVDYPQGLGDQFARAAKWAQYTQPGHWPDADMLPLGHLGPRPGWGEARDTRLTHDEQRTLITLWSMFRSPLMMGGNLPLSDEWTTSLLTNPEIIAVDQHSIGDRALITTDKTVVWTSKPENGSGNYVAIFNVSDAPETVHYSWSELNLPGASYKLRDLWERKDLGAAKEISVPVPSHGCVLYRVQKQ
jgi:alpha-galactosidase